MPTGAARICKGPDCTVALPVTARRDAEYHSTRCQVAAYRLRKKRQQEAAASRAEVTVVVEQGDQRAPVAPPARTAESA